MRGYHLDFSLSKLFIQFIGIISSVTDNPSRSFSCELMINSLLYESDFMWRSAFNPAGDRKTGSVCHCHDLGPFATLCFPDFEPPFLAETNVPSKRLYDLPLGICDIHERTPIGAITAQPPQQYKQKVLVSSLYLRWLLV